MNWKNLLFVLITIILTSPIRSTRNVKSKSMLHYLALVVTTGIDDSLL
jgi:hypothetical protein